VAGPSRSDQEELEALFGEEKKPPPPASSYRVRRRSGKVFGPYPVAEVAAMLERSELLGNEDVSSDDGATWVPVGTVPGFAEAVRRAASAPVRAPAPVVGPEPDKAKKKARPRRKGSGKGWMVAGAILLLLAGGGAAAFTLLGGLAGLRTLPVLGPWLDELGAGDAGRAAPLVARAQGALARGTFAGDREALDLAAKAVEAAPRDPWSLAVHALAASSLERRHGEPAGAMEKARANAALLAERQPGEAAALAAALALGPPDARREAELERAASKGRPDAAVLSLLAGSALERGDATRAATLFERALGASPGSARAAHGLGLSARRKGDAASARAAFERAIGFEPGHPPSRLELAAMAVEAGDAEGAQARLAELLAPESAAGLAPREKARAMALGADLLARRASGLGEADRGYQEALAADGRFVEGRVGLAQLRLRRGDAEGAVAALEPLGGAVADLPAAAETRIAALVRAGRALDAVNLADTALERSPGDPRLLHAKGLVLEATGKQAEAERAYRDAVGRAPDAWEPRLALGRLLLSRGDVAGAEPELVAAAAKAPRQAEAQAGLGSLRLAQGDLGAAEKSHRAALELDPDHAPAELGLARVELARGREAAARARLERAVALDPRKPAAQALLADLLWKSGDLEGAEKAFQAAVSLDPRNAVSRTRLGAVRLERGDLDGALGDLQAGANLAPDLAEAHHWLGRALLQKAEARPAVNALRRAVELASGDARIRLWLGMALERAGDLPEAGEAYRAAGEADPKLFEPHERLGLLYAGSGRCDLAVPAFERASALAPKVARLRVALADCKHEQKRYAEAIRVYREAARVDPSAAPPLYYRIGRSVQAEKGLRAAAPWYERAVREDPKNPMPFYYLGYHYKQRGERRRAIESFQAYLAARPEAEDRKDIEAEIEYLGGTP
jgi:tetratricopeptide (TPR) repeat protein